MGHATKETKGWALRAPSRGFLLLLAAASLLTLALITLGGIVRVTGSGLGCPDWPLCHGQLLPPFEFHALIEYAHRLTVSLVSLFVLSALSLAWWRYRGNPQILVPVTSAALFLGVAVVLGAVTVFLELPATVVTLHLGVALAVLASLVVAWTAAWRQRAGSGRSEEAMRQLFSWAVGAAAGTYLVVLSGSYVVGVGAASACTSWPLCTDSFFPGGDLVGINVAHRLLAVTFAVLSLWVASVAWRERLLPTAVRWTGATVGFLVVAQVLVGAANPWLGFHPAVAAVHLSLAAALWASLVALSALTWRAPAVATQEAGSPLAGQGSWGSMGDYVRLTKPWIIGLLLVTALGGMVLAAEAVPPPELILTVMVGGALASGGAGAINQALEQDIDRAMHRTQSRPVAGMRMSPARALSFGLALNLLAFFVLWAGANLLSATLAMVGSVFYVLVYTQWLKRSTTQNIVIGGAAGAIPPLVGWAAVTGSLALPALYLFAIIFFWTPAHFWALALILQKDYAAAGIPMLPVVEGEQRTRWAIFLYTLLVCALTLLFYTTTRSLGPIYLGSALVLGGLFIFYAVLLLRAPGGAATLRLYRFSLIYLGLLFLAIMVDSIV